MEEMYLHTVVLGQKGCPRWGTGKEPSNMVKLTLEKPLESMQVENERMSLGPENHRTGFGGNKVQVFEGVGAMQRGQCLVAEGTRLREVLLSPTQAR